MFSLKRGILPLGRIPGRDDIQMAIENEPSPASPPSFLSQEVPSSFWRENGFDFETRL
jgi:hypothetical protein